MYPLLPKSYKGAFPFKIATTSFIYPDDYLSNVEKLGPYLDEIELLFLESKPETSLPGKDVINDLKSMAASFGLTYNIHLPMDISMGHSGPAARTHAVETARRVMDLTGDLSPSTHTLHLPYDEVDSDKEHIKAWQGRICRSMETLLHHGLNPEMFSVETLDYPFNWLEDIIETFNLSVCIDIGHLMVNGYDYLSTFNKYAKQTPILHLAGVENSKDHLSLKRMPKTEIRPLMEMLRQFTGVVSLEVFSFQDLDESLQVLDECLLPKNM